MERGGYLEHVSGTTAASSALPQTSSDGDFWWVYTRPSRPPAQSYTWDKANNKTQRVELGGGTPAKTYDYQYDSLNRLLRSRLA